MFLTTRSLMGNMAFCQQLIPRILSKFRTMQSHGTGKTLCIKSIYFKRGFKVSHFVICITAINCSERVPHQTRFGLSFHTLTRTHFKN